MTDLSRRLSEETSKIRIAATALMLSVGLYALAWGVMISATLYGAWTSPVLGVDLPGAVSALSLRQLIQVYATILAVAAGAATSLVWPRAGWKRMKRKPRQQPGFYEGAAPGYYAGHNAAVKF